MDYEVAIALRYAPEYWANIPGYAKYEISNHGNVRNKSTLQVLKPYKTNRGYHTVGFWVNGKKKRLFVHRLVLAAFIGVSHLTVDHINEYKADNNLCNLRYLTQKENASIAQVGSQNSSAKLNVSQVREIKRLIKEGCITQPKIAAMYGVCLRTVEYISNGKTWKHVTT